VTQVPSPVLVFEQPTWKPIEMPELGVSPVMLNMAMKIRPVARLG